MALSRIKQEGKKKKILGQAMRSLQGRVAQSRMRKSIGAMQLM